MQARDEAEGLPQDQAEQALNSKNGIRSSLRRIFDAARNEPQQSENQRTTLQNRVQAAADGSAGGYKRMPTIGDRSAVAVRSAAHAGRFATTLVSRRAEVAPPARKADANRRAACGEHPPPGTANGERRSSSGCWLSTGLDIDRLLHGLGNRQAAARAALISRSNDPRACRRGSARLEVAEEAGEESSRSLRRSLNINSGTITAPASIRSITKNYFILGSIWTRPTVPTVYSTGAGTVIFTGNMDSYGKVVEIDHGHGIVTRYAHLHRILVAKGQKVGLHSPNRGARQYGSKHRPAPALRSSRRWPDGRSR